MALVAYSDSEDEEDPLSTRVCHPPAAIKQNTADLNGLPSLPSSFLDLYSSTVRRSAQDDPSVHGGRKRAVPHVEGQWSAHVYTEWLPSETELEVLSAAMDDDGSDQYGHHTTHSLLRNDLGVTLPLHISLSRPLILKTPQKDEFLLSIQQTVSTSKVRPFSVRPRAIRWHPNEDNTRHFLVLQLDRTANDELGTLLQHCNEVASRFNQPLLYMEEEDSTRHAESHFHVSLAWSVARPQDGQATTDAQLPEDLLESIRHLQVSIAEIKVRIGQDVTTLPLSQARSATRTLFS